MGSFLDDVFGSKPSLPAWHGLDLANEQRVATRNNLAIAPEASKLANLTEDQILSMLRTAIPNFDSIRDTAGSNILSELKGEVPKDVQDSIVNSAAGRSLGLGVGGSGFGRDLVARDLGITSLNLTEKGLSSAESWIASTERMLSPAMAAYTGMFVTPGQQAAFDANERDKQFEHDWLGAQIEAMPDPGTAGIIHQFDGTTLLGRNAPQQSGQQTPGTDPGNSGENDWASGWQTVDVGGSAAGGAVTGGAGGMAVGGAEAGAGAGAGATIGAEAGAVGPVFF